MPDNELSRKRRKTVRLAEYDYTSPGAYFVTLCTHQNQNFFGRIKEGKVLLSEAGEMVCGWWCKIPEKFPNVELDICILMPDHLHGIVIILEPKEEPDSVGADPCVRPEAGRGKQRIKGLPQIIKWFKTMTTNGYIRGVRQGKWESFDRHLWQRSYYEHVVRRVENISEVREYILNNPLRWELKRKDG